MTKSLTSKIYLKGKLFGFKMNTSKSLEENLDDFNVIVIGLENIAESIYEENQAVILLNALLESYRDLRTIMQYGRTSLSLEDVVSALRSRDLEDDKKDKKINNAEGLNVKGNWEHKSKNKGKGNSRGRNKTRSNSKSRGTSKGFFKTRTCWYCKKELLQKKERLRK